MGHESSGQTGCIRAACVVMAGILAVSAFTGCSSNRKRAVNRARVLEAENINLRQQTATMQDQMRQAHVAQDDALAREQQLRGDLVAARQEAQAAEAEAAGDAERAASIRARAERFRRRGDELRSELGSGPGAP